MGTAVTSAPGDPAPRSQPSGSLPAPFCSLPAPHFSGHISPDPTILLQLWLPGAFVFFSFYLAILAIYLFFILFACVRTSLCGCPFFPFNYSIMKNEDKLFHLFRLLYRSNKVAPNGLTVRRADAEHTWLCNRQSAARVPNGICTLVIGTINNIDLCRLLSSLVSHRVVETQQIKSHPRNSGGVLTA